MTCVQYSLHHPTLHSYVFCWRSPRECDIVPTLDRIILTLPKGATFPSQRDYGLAIKAKFKSEIVKIASLQVSWRRNEWIKFRLNSANMNRYTGFGHETSKIHCVIDTDAHEKANHDSPDLDFDISHSTRIGRTRVIVVIAKISIVSRNRIRISTRWRSNSCFAYTMRNRQRTFHPMNADY